MSKAVGLRLEKYLDTCSLVVFNQLESRALPHDMFVLCSEVKQR